MENYTTFFLRHHEWILIVVIFSLLCVAYQAGFIYGRRKVKEKAPSHSTLIFSQLAGLIGFLGILLAFCFSMSSSRYDIRKQLIIQESLNIGTAYFRIGLIPDTLARREIRSLLKLYLDSRIRLYDPQNSLEDIKKERIKSDNLQVLIWARSAELGRKYDDINSSLIIQSLNSMIDITGSIRAAVENHVPGLILVTLVVVSLFTVLTLGYAHGFLQDKSWVFAISINFIIVAILFLIVDMDSPTSGFVTVDTHSLTELKSAISKYTP